MAKRWIDMYGVTKPRSFRFKVQFEGDESTFTIYGKTEEEARENHKANFPDEDRYDFTVISYTPRYALSIMLFLDSKPVNYHCNDIIEWRSFVRKNKTIIAGVYMVGGSNDLGNACKLYEVVMQEYSIKWIKDKQRKRGKRK